jgi:hypothetical protein
MATHSLEFLVGITGSYAGAGIQHNVPAALVYYARQEAGAALGLGVRIPGTIIRAPSSTGCELCSYSCGPSPASCSQHGTTVAAHCRRKHLILIIVTKIAKLMSQSEHYEVLLAMPAGKKVKKLISLSRMSSIVGTAAGNHSRPITIGSIMFQYKHLVVVAEGQVDPDQGKVRTDILLYSSKTDSWMTSLKQDIRSRSRLHDIIMLEDAFYLIWVPSRQPTYTAVDQNVMRALMETFQLCKGVDRYLLRG